MRLKNIQRRHQYEIQGLLEGGPLQLGRRANDDRSKEVRALQSSKMFIPLISTLLWVLAYSLPAEVVSIPLDVAASPADLQILQRPQIANVTSNPKLLVNASVNATTSEAFQIPGTNYHVELSAPAIKKLIVVDTLQHLLRYEIQQCRAQVTRGRGSAAPYAIMITGPAPDNLKFEWLNLDYQKKGSFADLVRIFGFLLSISTMEKTPDPNPWFATAFSYVLHWESYSGQPEKVGSGLVGL